MLTLIEFIFWCLMAPATIYVKKKYGESISHKVRDWLPKWLDYVALFVIVGFTWYFWGFAPATVAIRYLVLGHWFWSEE